MMEDLRLNISGMSCNHCVARVTNALKQVPSVSVRDVKIGSADLRYDPSGTSPEAIVGAVESAGYATSVAGSPSR